MNTLEEYQKLTEEIEKLEQQRSELKFSDEIIQFFLKRIEEVSWTISHCTWRCELHTKDFTLSEMKYIIAISDNYCTLKLNDQMSVEAEILHTDSSEIEETFVKLIFNTFELMVNFLKTHKVLGKSRIRERCEVIQKGFEEGKILVEMLED